MVLPSAILYLKTLLFNSTFCTSKGNFAVISNHFQGQESIGFASSTTMLNRSLQSYCLLFILMGGVAQKGP